MPEYVALLRGIAPMNPNQKNEKLRGVFEELGFEDVRTVISSGNVLFRSDSTDVEAMEATIETAWPEKLGFESATLIRSIPELQRLVDLDPFAGYEHSRESYLLVTFCRRAAKIDFELPYRPPASATQLVAQIDRELFTVTDTTQGQRAGSNGLARQVAREGDHVPHLADGAPHPEEGANRLIIKRGCAVPGRGS